MNINIPGIDITKAIQNSGSEELFTELEGAAVISFDTVGGNS